MINLICDADKQETRQGTGSRGTSVDNFLDFDVLTEYCLTYQKGQYTITETDKAQYYLVFRNTWTSNSVYAPPVRYPSGPPV